MLGSTWSECGLRTYDVRPYPFFFWRVVQEVDFPSDPFLVNILSEQTELYWNDIQGQEEAPEVLCCAATL